MTVFNADDNTPSNFLEALVGEGKKFQDPESLARGKWEADAHIARLEAELEEARNQTALEERVAAILGKQNEPTPNPNGNVAPTPPTNPKGPAEIDLAEEVRKIISATEEQKTVKQNVDAVAAKLIELHGSEAAANAAVKARAQDLGVSVEFLQDVAAKSPKAFFATTGLDAAASAPPGPTHGNVNPAALATHNPSSIKPNTYKWYQQLRKENPKAYSKMSMQMHNDALKLGSNFYD